MPGFSKEWFERHNLLSSSPPDSPAEKLGQALIPKFTLSDAAAVLNAAVLSLKATCEGLVKSEKFYRETANNALAANHNLKKALTAIMRFYGASELSIPYNPNEQPAHIGLSDEDGLLKISMCERNRIN